MELKELTTSQKLQVFEKARSNSFFPSVKEGGDFFICNELLMIIQDDVDDGGLGFPKTKYPSPDDLKVLIPEFNPQFIMDNFGIEVGKPKVICYGDAVIKDVIFKGIWWERKDVKTRREVLWKYIEYYRKQLNK